MLLEAKTSCDPIASLVPPARSDSFVFEPGVIDAHRLDLYTDAATAGLDIRLDCS